MTPKELGYFKDNNFDYSKVYSNNGKVIAILEIKPDYYMRIYAGRIVPKIDIDSQKVIDEIQIAYNNLIKDLKELNK